MSDLMVFQRTVPAAPPGRRVIFRLAMRRIDRIWESDLPFDLKVDMHGDVLEQVGWELDRAARRRRVSYLSRRVHR